MISIAICSCLNKPEREEYLKRAIDSIRGVFEDDVEILIGFDKYGKEIDGATCYTHERGMGHSWNWAIQNASNEHILQIEDDWTIEVGGGNMPTMPDKESFFYYLNNRISVLDEFGGIFRFTNTDDQFWSPGKTEHVLNDFKFTESNRPNEFKIGTWDMYFYTNQPHMKKKGLHNDVGWYVENEPAHVVEIDMCRKFYNSGKRSFLNPFFTLVHIGHVQSRSK